MNQFLVRCTYDYWDKEGLKTTTESFLVTSLSFEWACIKISRLPRMINARNFYDHTIP